MNEQRQKSNAEAKGRRRRRRMIEQISERYPLFAKKFIEEEIEKNKPYFFPEDYLEYPPETPTAPTDPDNQRGYRSR